MTTHDCRGKCIRVGDRFHKAQRGNRVNKGQPNGRVIPSLRTFRVRSVTEHGRVEILNKRFVPGREFVKE